MHLKSAWQMNKILTSHLALFFANLIYALTFTLAKDVMPDTIPPIGFILLRVTGAMVLFHLIHFILVGEKVKRSDYLILILCGLFGVAINMSFFFFRLKLYNAYSCGCNHDFCPYYYIYFGCYFSWRKKSPHRIVGVVLGAIGAIILAVYGRKFETGNPHLALGNLFVLINAFSYGLYLTIVKPLMDRYHFITIMKWVFTVGFFAVLPFGYSDVLVVEWAGISNKIWAEIAFVVVGTSFLAYMFNIYALKRLRASTVGFYIYLQPVLATIVALILGSDKLDAIKILASLIIFIGVYLVGRNPKARA